MTFEETNPENQRLDFKERRSNEVGCGEEFTKGVRGQDRLTFLLGVLGTNPFIQTPKKDGLGHDEKKKKKDGWRK